MCRLIGDHIGAEGDEVVLEQTATSCQLNVSTPSAVINLAEEHTVLDVIILEYTSPLVRTYQTNTRNIDGLIDLEMYTSRKTGSSFCLDLIGRNL